MFIDRNSCNRYLTNVLCCCQYKIMLYWEILAGIEFGGIVIIHN